MKKCPHCGAVLGDGAVSVADGKLHLLGGIGEGFKVTLPHFIREYGANCDVFEADGAEIYCDETRHVTIRKTVCRIDQNRIRDSEDGTFQNVDQYFKDLGPRGIHHHNVGATDGIYSGKNHEQGRQTKGKERE